jgi:hypothetical protein
MAWLHVNAFPAALHIFQAWSAYFGRDTKRYFDGLLHSQRLDA